MKNFENFKITLFGDSIGRGIVTDNGKLELIKESAVGLFESGYGIKIDNRSAYGQSLKKIYQRGLIDRYIQTLDLSQKNVAVLELGGNDADFDWKTVGLHPEMEHDANTPVKEFARIYGEILQKLKRANVEVIVCTIVPIDSKRFFNRVIGGLTDKSRVLDFFNGDFNTIHRHQEMFNNEILKVAYGYGAKVIDLRQKFLSTNTFESFMCQDGIHPNGDGHAQIFSAVNEFLATA